MNGTSGGMPSLAFASRTLNSARFFVSEGVEAAAVAMAAAIAGSDIVESLES